MWNASDASLPPNTAMSTVNSGGIAATLLGTGATSLLSSGAKDVDIYMGNACVWSGMLPSESDPQLSLKEGCPSDRKVESSQPIQTYHYVSSSHHSNSNMGIVQGDGNATGGSSAGGFVVFRAPSAVVRLSSSSSAGVENKTIPSSSSVSSSNLAVGHADDGSVTVGTMQGYQAAVAAIAMKKQTSSSSSSSPPTHEARLSLLSTETAQMDGDKPLWLVGLRPPSASAVPSTSSVVANDSAGVAIGLGLPNRPFSSGRRRATEMMTAEDTTQPPQPQPHPPSQPNYDGESSSSSYIPSSLMAKNMENDDPTTNTTLSSSRSSRRLRPRGDNDTSVETTNLPTNHLTLTTGRRNNTKEVRDDDDQLRRSLDAMNLSDRFNRGRLSHAASMTRLEMGASVDMGAAEGHLEDGMEGGVGVLGSYSVDHMIPSSSLAEGGVGGITRVRSGRRASNARASNEVEEHYDKDKDKDKDKDTVNLKQSPASAATTSAAKRESRARRIEVRRSMQRYSLILPNTV